MYHIASWYVCGHFINCIGYRSNAPNSLGQNDESSGDGESSVLFCGEITLQQETAGNAQRLEPLTCRILSRSAKLYTGTVGIVLNIKNTKYIRHSSLKSSVTNFWSGGRQNFSRHAEFVIFRNPILNDDMQHQAVRLALTLVVKTQNYMNCDVTNWHAKDTAWSLYFWKTGKTGFRIHLEKGTKREVTQIILNKHNTSPALGSSRVTSHILQKLILY